MKGVPLRLELGPKDLEKEHAVLVRRDTGEKIFVKISDLHKKVKEVLAEIQTSLFIKAKQFLDDSLIETYDWDTFVSAINAKKLVKTTFCGEAECEDEIKEKTGGATSRCIPFDSKKPDRNCVHCGKEAQYEVYFSKSY